MDSPLKPPTEVQIKRRNKELSLLSKLPGTMKVTTSEAPIGFTIQVEVGKEHMKAQGAKPVTFNILLSYKYPFQPPRVHCVTSFTDISVDDSRDFLGAALGKEWMPSTTIYDVIRSLPRLVDRLLENKDNPEFLKSIGSFHLGELYDLNWFKNTRCFMFKCQEESEKEGRIALLSDLCLLLFDVTTQDPEHPYHNLVFYSGLEFLQKLRRGMHSPKRLTLFWTQEGNQALELTLLVDEAESFIDELMGKMRNLGANVGCNKKSKRMYVNASIPTETQITALLKTIAELEQKPDAGNSIELMKGYQKAVEYYSAIGSSEYAVYLNKIRELIKTRGESEKKPDKVEAVEPAGPATNPESAPAGAKENKASAPPSGT